MSFGFGGQALSHSGISLLMEEMMEKAMKLNSYANGPGGVMAPICVSLS